ncbi:MAG TPA: acetyl-CoA hydrolase/transferase C-terminal domain-containing protein [Acidimicrobiales bacterium]|nr:acetyl-CoA hydrolase/transferase C-terminal domain-containing protein [Acidimicrobiales bacterium]
MVTGETGLQRRPLIVMADGPDGPLPDPALVAGVVGVADAEVVLGWVVRRPSWLETTGVPVTTLLTGPGTRAAVASGRVRAVPARLSAIPGLVAGRLRPDVAVVGAYETASGWRLAHSPGFAIAAVANAKRVVVERWKGGDPQGFPALDVDVHEVIDRSDPPDPPPINDPGPAHQRIGELVSALISEGATIQWGPGVVGASVISSLRVPVRVRSGLVTDELVSLHRAGWLVDPAEAAYIWGGDALKAMVAGGGLRLRDVDHTHDLTAISGIERFVAINTALQVGLDGSANVEVARGRIVAGAGGHPDFSTGASRSPGGMSIVALPSTAGGRSTIVPAPEVVTTPRSDVDLIVTEHGIADLRGLTAAERAQRIIDVAAPEFRDELRGGLRP